MYIFTKVQNTLPTDGNKIELVTSIFSKVTMGHSKIHGTAEDLYTRLRIGCGF